MGMMLMMMLMLMMVLVLAVKVMRMTAGTVFVELMAQDTFFYRCARLRLSLGAEPPCTSRSLR